jgi:O-antigen ligase
MAAAFAVGTWAAAVAVWRISTAGLLLTVPVALAAIAWWTLAGPGRWLLLFFGSLLLAPPMPISLGANTGLHIAPLFAGMGILAGTLRTNEWRPLRGSLTLAFGLFLAVLAESTVSAALYSGPLVGAGTLARVLLFAMGVYVFLYTLSGPEGGEANPLRKARFLFWIGLASAALACVDFHFQFPAPAGYGPQFVWLAEGVFRRAQGVFYEASTLGNLCVFFLVMVVVSMFHTGGRAVAPRPVLLLGGIVFSAALVLTYSRASILSLIVALAAFAHIRGARLWKTAVLVLGCLVPAALALHFALPAISESYWGRLTASFQYIGSSPDGVLSGRLTNWTMLIGFLTREPWHGLFGIGYKTLPYTDFAGHPVIADNTYLSLLVETGIVGLAVFVFLNAAILRTAWRAATSPRGHASFFGTWIFCFWVGQVFQMLSGDLITYWRVLPVYLWVLATAAREAGENG